MITFDTSNRLVDAMLAYEVLRKIKNYYPGFEHWYVNKVIPGIVTGDDILICAREHDQIIGVALGKKREHDVKLRCIRVDDSYQKRGTGLHLVDKMLVALDNDRPHCTVSEEMFHDYSRAFINHYRFALSAVNKGQYRRNKLEYAFNDQNGKPIDTMEFYAPANYAPTEEELAQGREVFASLTPTGISY